MNLTGQITSSGAFRDFLAGGRADDELVVWSGGLDDDAAIALARWEPAAALRTLDLSHNHIGPVGAAALAASPHLRGLTSLRLYHNAVAPVGAAAIGAGWWRLRSLNLCGNALGPMGIAALRGPALAELESLHLGWNELGDDGMAQLAGRRWPALGELNVRANELTAFSFDSFPRLAKLGVDDNPLGDDGLAALVRSPAFARLTWLNLTATELTERALELLRAADTSALKELRIGENGVSEDAVDAMLGRTDATERLWEIRIGVRERGGEEQLHTCCGKWVDVGRVAGNTIVIPKGNVSKRHCRIHIDKQGQAIVVDMHSTNGMWVNGRKIRGPTPVGEGDKIYVGDFVLRIAAPPRRID